VRGQHLRDRAKSAAAKLPRHRVGAVQIRIDYAHQSHRLALLLQFVIDPRMVASENANTHHRNGNRIVSLQEGTLTWLVASRNNKL
jgi:hypothetical protein